MWPQHFCVMMYLRCFWTIDVKAASGEVNIKFLFCSVKSEVNHCPCGYNSHWWMSVVDVLLTFSTCLCVMVILVTQWYGSGGKAALSAPQHPNTHRFYGTWGIPAFGLSGYSVLWHLRHFWKSQCRGMWQTQWYMIRSSLLEKPTLRHMELVVFLSEEHIAHHSCIRPIWHLWHFWKNVICHMTKWHIGIE